MSTRRYAARLAGSTWIALSVATLMLTSLFFGLGTNGVAAPIQKGQIEVLDGDTIEVDGVRFRLVGFDTPESRSRARCERERTLANLATIRLRQLVAGGGLDLVRVPCACRVGTEGTKRCNYGRLCGTLKARGKDVGTTLISEGLARTYVCSGTRCPRRPTWCG